MVYSINFLRFIAAISVVLLHIFMQYENKFGVDIDISLGGLDLKSLGSAGVDIFFIISGFVIYISVKDKNKKVSKFLISRVLRIAPLYYFYTFLYVAISFLAPTSYKFDLVHFISSLLFIPSANSQSLITPVLYVGWTLSYEFYFYFVFSLLFLKCRLSTLTVSLILLIPPFVFYIIKKDFDFVQTRDIIINPILIEFAFGMLLAKYRNRLHDLSFYWSLVILFLSLALFALSATCTNDYFRFIFYGIPSLLLFVSFLSFERFEIFKSKIFILLGQSSYSLYLSHVISLPLIMKLLSSVSMDSIFLNVIISLVFCQLVAILSYKIVENRIACIKFLQIRRLFMSFK